MGDTVVEKRLRLMPFYLISAEIDTDTGNVLWRIQDSPLHMLSSEFNQQRWPQSQLRNQDEITH